MGSFNPVHNAHIHFACEARNHYNFDEIIFVPAYKPPHKEVGIEQSAHRYKMLELALADYPFFKISDIEYKREDKSYTYPTIIELYRTLPDIEGKINFIIGTDAFLNIYSWHQGEELIKLLHFIVIVRDEKEAEGCKNLKDVDFDFLNASKVDISSTMIRERLKNYKPVTDLVPPAVERYIKKNDLYRG